MEMEVDETVTYGNKMCYEFPRGVQGNFSIARDSCDKTLYRDLVFWTKYHLLVYENLNFKQPRIMLEPGFEIKQVLLYKRNFLCLDSSGSLNINVLESTEDSPTLFSNTFQISEQWGVETCTLMYVHSRAFLISLVHINSEFELKVKGIDFSSDDYSKILYCDPAHLLSRGRGILTCCKISEQHSEINKIFHQNEKMKCDLVVICLDKINVHGCLLNRQIEYCNLVRLYESPSEIIDIKIYSTNDIFCLLLALACGTVIKIPLTNIVNNPEVIHLNTAIYRLELFRESIIYTDGVTLWKMENIFAKSKGMSKGSDLKFKQFFVRNVRDFCIYDEKMVCITFTNLIYMFNINDETCYVPTPAIENCTAAQVLNNSECLHKIMDVIKINEELVKNINKEKEYLTILALSNRQDIMENLIQISCSVYDSYNDVIEENTDLFLTDDPSDYLNTESYYFLLKMSVSTIQHKLSVLLKNILEDVKIHVTLTTDKVLKTTSITLRERLKKQTFVISLKQSKVKYNRRLQAHIKIITNISGPLDRNQNLWKTLYEKHIVFNAENFIKTHFSGNPSYLKNKVALSEQILKTAEHYHGTLFRFQRPEESDWTFYLKLPRNYTEILNNREIYYEHLLPKKVRVLMDHNKLEDFLNSRSSLQFEVGDIKVQINVLNENSTSLMKVSSKNAMIASDIRNFFSKLIFQRYISQCKPNREFIDLQTTTIKNMEDEIRSCIVLKIPYQEYLTLMTKFQNVIYGSLPI